MYMTSMKLSNGVPWSKQQNGAMITEKLIDPSHWRQVTYFGTHMHAGRQTLQGLLYGLTKYLHTLQGRAWKQYIAICNQSWQGTLFSFLGVVKVIGVCNCKEAIVTCESIVSACINSGWLPPSVAAKITWLDVSEKGL